MAGARRSDIARLLTQHAAAHCARQFDKQFLIVATILKARSHNWYLRQTSATSSYYHDVETVQLYIYRQFLSFPPTVVYVTQVKLTTCLFNQTVDTCYYIRTTCLYLKSRRIVCVDNQYHSTRIAAKS